MHSFLKAVRYHQLNIKLPSFMDSPSLDCVTHLVCGHKTHVVP